MKFQERLFGVGICCSSLFALMFVFFTPHGSFNKRIKQRDQRTDMFPVPGVDLMLKKLQSRYEGEQVEEKDVDESKPKHKKAGADKKENSKHIPTSEEIPESLQGLIKSVEELKGNHSDFVDEKCENPKKRYKWKSDKKYDYIGPFNYLTNYKNPCWLNVQKKVDCVPYFYFIGTPKAGSTDLYNRLLQHPDAVGGVTKEIRWFDRKRFGTSEWSTFDDYIRFYHPGTEQVRSSVVPGTSFHPKIIGDAGPTYYFSTHYWKKIPGNEGCPAPRVTAVSHIHHLWPQAKLIMLVRNPTSRMYSAYLYNSPATGGNQTAEQFHEWTVQSIGVWEDCMKEHPIRFCMYEGMVEWKQKLWSLHIGLYSRYILDVLRMFPKDQLLVVHLEDYGANMEAWLKKVFDFLELDPPSSSFLKYICGLPRANTGSGQKKAGPMWPKTKKLLDDFYGPYNRELADIMSDQKYLWLGS